MFELSLIFFFFRPTTKLVGTFLHIFPETDKPESKSLRNMIHPDVRFDPEEPLDDVTKAAWSRYVKSLDNWDRNKNN